VRALLACARDVGADAEHPTLCGRCVSNLHGEGEHVPVPNIKRWLWLAGLIIVLDQLSKWIVLNDAAVRRDDLRRAVLELGADLQPRRRLQLPRRQPAAGSAGSSPCWRSAFPAGSSVMLRKHRSEFLLSLALTLVMGGALGNVIDRVRFRRRRRFHPVARRRFLLAGLQRRRFGDHRRRHFARFRAVDRNKQENPR
jgi:signal peptidase II